MVLLWDVVVGAVCYYGHCCCNHLLFPPSVGMALPPAFPTLVENHVGHGYMGAMEPKQVYQAPPQVTPSRYSPVPRHMLGEEDFTRSVLGWCDAAAAVAAVVVVLRWLLLFLNVFIFVVNCQGSKSLFYLFIFLCQIFLLQ